MLVFGQVMVTKSRLSDFEIRDPSKHSTASPQFGISYAFAPPPSLWRAPRWPPQSCVVFEGWDLRICSEEGLYSHDHIADTQREGGSVRIRGRHFVLCHCWNRSSLQLHTTLRNLYLVDQGRIRGGKCLTEVLQHWILNENPLGFWSVRVQITWIYVFYDDWVILRKVRAKNSQGWHTNYETHFLK